MAESGSEPVEALANPIINGPYGVPTHHFEMEPAGPTGEVIEHRRPSQPFVPVAPPRKARTRPADIDADVWASVYQTVSRPFAKPSTRKTAVKVINDFGDEVMKVFEVD